MRNCKHGELLTKEEINYIAESYRLSAHATQRVSERLMNGDIKNAILNSILAYYNTDGTINVAIDECSYFVFTDNGYMITFKEPSHNGVTVYKKWELAKKGISR